MAPGVVGDVKLVVSNIAGVVKVILGRRLVVY